MNTKYENDEKYNKIVMQSMFDGFTSQKMTSIKFFIDNTPRDSEYYNAFCKFMDSNNYTMDTIRDVIFGFKNDDLSELILTSFWWCTKSYDKDIFKDDFAIMLSRYVIYSYNFSIPDTVLFKKFMFYRGQGRHLMVVNDEYTNLVNTEIVKSNVLLKEIVPIIIRYVSYV